MQATFSRIALLLLVLLFACWLMPSSQAQNKPKQDPTSIVEYHARIPLGWESFKLSGQYFYLMGSVENPDFEGWEKVIQGNRTRLVNANDVPVKKFPQHLQFRITASAREKLLDSRPFFVSSKLPMNDYLLGLRFRLAVFRGVHEWRIHPAAVEPIGMPADISYSERIYRVHFDLGQVAIQDRIVLEVLAPNGQRLSKFHVDLY